MLENLKDIITGVKNGQNEVYSEVVRHYQHQIYGYLFRMVINHQDAEDLTQQTFIIAYYKINQLKNVEVFKSWLFSIAHSQVLQFYRKKKIYTETINKLKEEYGYLDHSNMDGISLDKIRSILTPYEMSLLMLRVVEEMSYDELSLCLNKKAPTLRKKYERIRMKLRNQLGDEKEVLNNV